MAARSMVTVSIRLPEDVVRKIEVHAARLGEAAPALMRRWLIEKAHVERFSGPSWRNLAAATLAEAAVNAKGSVLNCEITSYDVSYVENLKDGDEKTIGNMWRPLTNSVQVALNGAGSEAWVREAFADAVLNETRAALGSAPPQEVVAFLGTLFAGLVGQGLPSTWAARLQGRRAINDVTI